MDYNDFELQELFEGICEQVLDYLGVENGRSFLYHNFVGFEDFIDMKIDAYKQGKRITQKTDLTDDAIKRICEGWKNE